MRWKHSLLTGRDGDYRKTVDLLLLLQITQYRKYLERKCPCSTPVSVIHTEYDGGGGRLVN